VNQATCDMCHTPNDSLVWRNYSVLCPRCCIVSDRYHWQDISIDPTKSSRVRQEARRKVRNLGRLLVALRKESA
jgi:hypothetical protein